MNNCNMFTILCRSIILYFLILVVFRLMGKRQIGQLQPFELVLTLIIADLATIPMGETTLPILNGVVPLLTLMIVHFIITVICQHSNKINDWINGKPLIIINPKGIDYNAIKQLNITIDDVLEGLRSSDIFSLDEVQYAIVETNGSINVIPKAKYKPATAEDVKSVGDEESIPITIISDGKINDSNLQLANLTKISIQNFLKKQNINKIENILALTIDKNKKVYLQEKGKKYKIIKNSKIRESA